MSIQGVGTGAEPWASASAAGARETGPPTYSGSGTGIQDVGGSRCGRSGAGESGDGDDKFRCLTSSEIYFELKEIELYFSQFANFF